MNNSFVKGCLALQTGEPESLITAFTLYMALSIYCLQLTINFPSLRYLISKFELPVLGKNINLLSPGISFPNRIDLSATCTDTKFNALELVFEI